MSCLLFSTSFTKRSIASTRALISSLFSLELTLICWSSLLRLSIISVDLFILSTINSCFCFKLAISMLTSSSIPFLLLRTSFNSVSFLVFSTTCFSSSEFLSSVSLSSSLNLLLFLLISWISEAILLLSRVNPWYCVIILSFWVFACFKLISTVFLIICCSWSPALILFISSLTALVLLLLSSNSLSKALFSSLNLEIYFSSSSISLRLPKRLLLFLNAPPEIEPPTLRYSPSSVTILTVYLYLRSMEMALSTVSTTITLPSKYFATPSYSFLTSTKSLARPITPFSSKASGALKFVLLLILLKGKNVARPNLCFLRYSIVSLAVVSVSVTIFWIFPPKAVSMATSYFLSTLIISATTPIIPFFVSLSSITFLILFPYPSYLSVMFFKASRLDLVLWYFSWFFAKAAVISEFFVLSSAKCCL